MPSQTTAPASGTRTIRRAMATAAVACGVAATLPATASADLFAITEVNPTGNDLDLIKVNAVTGATASLPAGVNSTQHELHPSVSPSGERLVFARRDIEGGSVRIIVVDLEAGVPVDLFNAFEAAEHKPYTPHYHGDTRHVVMGRDHAASGMQPARLVRALLTKWPDGPFQKLVAEAPGPPASTSGRTMNPASVAFDIDHLAYVSEDAGMTRRIVVDTPAGTGSLSSTGQMNHPALAASKDVVVYSQATLRNGTELNSQILFAGLDGFPESGGGVLPALVNTAAHETKPAFTAGERYLAFIRRDGAAQPRLFVFDTDTQTLLNPAGVELAAAAPDSPLSRLAHTDGAVALINRRVIKASFATLKAFWFLLEADSRVAIIVQRIVGRTRLLGRTVPKLEMVGRVPLGSFKKGRTRRAAWDRRVGRRKLRKGTYLVTPAAVTRKGEIRDLGTPRRITIR